MDTLAFSPELHQLINDVFVWIGFGTVVGLAARGLMPGRDPAGAITTLLLGIAGSVLGCGFMGCFFATQRVTPTSPLGMLVAVAGAFVLLGLFRVYGDLLPWKLDAPQTRAPHGSSSGQHGAYDYNRKRYSSAAYED